MQWYICWVSSFFNPLKSYFSQKVSCSAPHDSFIYLGRIFLYLQVILLTPNSYGNKVFRPFSYTFLEWHHLTGTTSCFYWSDVSFSVFSHTKVHSRTKSTGVLWRHNSVKCVYMTSRQEVVGKWRNSLISALNCNCSISLAYVLHLPVLSISLKPDYLVAKLNVTKRSQNWVSDSMRWQVPILTK